MMIDIHCHILPGIDDGPATLEEALAMARMAAADGVRAIVATPHVAPDFQWPEPAHLRELTAQLNEAVRAEGLPLRILPGMEAPATPELLEAYAEGRVLTLGDLGRYLLIELPTHASATYVPDLFFRLQLMGLTPIVAHIERAALFRVEPHRLREFQERGYVLQMNVEMLNGGFWSRRYARRLIREGLVTVLASDAHDLIARPPRLSSARRYLKSAMLFETLTAANPARLLEGLPADFWREEIPAP